MTSAMGQVLKKMEGDWEFIEDYFNDPEAALAGLELDPAEREALIARDLRQLRLLGIGEDGVEAILSGAHSPTCVPTTCPVSHLGLYPNS